MNKSDLDILKGLVKRYGQNKVVEAIDELPLETIKQVASNKKTRSHSAMVEAVWMCVVSEMFKLKEDDIAAACGSVADKGIKFMASSEDGSPTGEIIQSLGGSERKDIDNIRRWYDEAIKLSKTDTEDGRGLERWMRRITKSLKDADDSDV